MNTAAKRQKPQTQMLSTASSASASAVVYAIDASVTAPGLNNRVEVSQPGPTLLRCKHRLYEIDPEHIETFRLRALYKVNPQEEAMYIMYHDKAYTMEKVIKYSMDDVMSEVWCRRWRPSTAQLIELGPKALEGFAKGLESSKKRLLDGDSSSGEKAIKKQRATALMETIILAAIEFEDVITSTT